MSERETLSIIIPAYNEAGNIRRMTQTWNILFHTL